MSHLCRLFAALFVAIAPACAALAAEPIASNGAACAVRCGKRPGDQFWVVSTRHLACNAGVTETLPDFRVQYFAQNRWHDGDAQMFLAHDDPARSTVIYVHGNRFDADQALASGWESYYAITRTLPAERNVRYVIWTWPSEKEFGPIRDARHKLARTPVESYYLARLMTAIDPKVPTSVVGYSYGARVALGAVHMSAGGQFEGRIVPDAYTLEGSMFRIALIAPASEDDALLPGARFEMTMSRTEHLLSFYNPCDRALKFFHVVDKCQRPDAIGLNGIYGISHLEGAERITERNVSGFLGKSHDEDMYLGSRQLMDEVRAAVLP